MKQHFYRDVLFATILAFFIGNISAYYVFIGAYELNPSFVSDSGLGATNFAILCAMAWASMVFSSGNLYLMTRVRKQAKENKANLSKLGIDTQISKKMSQDFLIFLGFSAVLTWLAITFIALVIGLPILLIVMIKAHLSWRGIYRQVWKPNAQ